MERAHGGRLASHGLLLAAVLFVVLGGQRFATLAEQRSDVADAVLDTPIESASPPPLTLPAPNPQPTDPKPVRFAPAVERWRSLSRDATATVQHATGVSLDEDLVLALVAVESSGKPAARSARGAVGLTQVEPATFTDLTTRYRELLAGRSLEQPSVNLLAGSLYLADCARYLDADLTNPTDLALVLHAYNMGPRAATEWRETGTFFNDSELQAGLPAETIEHSARILAAVYAHGV